MSYIKKEMIASHDTKINGVSSSKSCLHRNCILLLCKEFRHANDIYLQTLYMSSHQKARHITLIFYFACMNLFNPIQPSPINLEIRVILPSKAL